MVKREIVGLYWEGGGRRIKYAFINVDITWLSLPTTVGFFLLPFHL